ncbi:MAG: CASTOR/POLLUX-related putative ion channel [bacterium]
MSQQQFKFKERLRYRLDNFFSKGGTAVFLALLFLFFIAFVIMGSLRLLAFVLFPDENIEEMGFLLWHAFFQIIDSGSLAELDAQSNLAGKLVAIATIFMGLVLFSSMVAFITQQFEMRLSILRKGKSKVLEKNHTIILGFDIRCLEIIKELIEANASEKDAVVVVMADREKEEMDDYFHEHLPDTQTTRIICRTGLASSPQALRKIGVDKGRSVILTNPSPQVATNTVKMQGDYQILKAIMAISSVTGEEKMPPVIAKLFFERNRDLARGIAPGKVVVLDEDLILAKILVQTSRIPGLSLVYSQLVGFVGDEIYFSTIPEFIWGKTFGEMQFHFQRSVPIGLRRSDLIMLNPKPETVLEEGDEAIVIAEDDSTIHFFEQPVVEPTELSYSENKVLPKIEKYLIFGWNRKLPILVDEYSGYIHDGSVIDIIVPRKSDAMERIFQQLSSKHPKVRMTLQQVNPSMSNFPGRLYPHRYDNVIIMAGENGTTEEIDSETISMLLKFRHFFREVRTKGEEVHTQLITEVMDSANAQIIQQSGVKDFLVSNQFVSKMMAQISEDSDVYLVYEDLFKEHGSEIYLKPAWLYFENLPMEVSFADIMLAAQKRNEVCFGVKIKSEEYEPKFGIHLIPPKEQVFLLEEGDTFITLAEDEY